MTVLALAVLFLSSGACDVPLPGDLNWDCEINLEDVLIAAGQWLGESGTANLGGGDRVDMVDFAMRSQQLGQVGGRSCLECEDWQRWHPAWIFCDDFDDGTELRRDGRYFEYDDDDGDFVVVARGAGINASSGMRTIFQAGEVGAGGLKLAFGRVPYRKFDKGIRNTEDFRDIYYRIYVKNQAGWQGSPAKLSRATVFADPNWSQAMIAHLWSSGDYLVVDPASGVDERGNVVTTKYNDFANLDWLGNLRGTTPIFGPGHDDQWYCIEAHVRLNDPGLSNGVQEFWIDGNLEARQDELDFVGSYTGYGINAIFIENYWNSGSVKKQERYFDNFVVSTERIGCMCDDTVLGVPSPDLNGDFVVNIEDLALLVEHWGQNDPTCDIAPPPFGDGIVNDLDLERLMSYWNQVLDDPTLIAHWALDEAEGAVAYDSAGVNDASIIGEPVWQPDGGLVDGALQLDGVGDYVITGAVANPADGPISVLAWIKGGAPGQVVLSQIGGVNWLRTDPLEGNLMTELTSPDRRFGGPMLSQTNVTDGEWYRIGLVWDGSYRHLYVDGVEVAKDATALSGLEGSGGGLYLGVGSTLAPGSFFSGLIDDVRIYNRAVKP